MKDDTTFPFTLAHFKKFKKELLGAGSFDKLMVEKQALEYKDGEKSIIRNYESEGYKKKFLTGTYASLQPFYETEMPYVFWRSLYDMLLEQDVDAL